MSVTATDSSAIAAGSNETSTNSPSNDAGAGLINGYANLVLDSYQYTDQSGSQSLNFGDKVWVDDGKHKGTGSVYQYMGTTRSIALSTGNIGTDTTGYANLQYWKALTQNNLIQGQEVDIALGVVGKLTGKEGLTGNATSYFGLIDFNQVQSSTSAYVENVTTSSAGLSVDATDAASISATDASVVNATSVGGNNGNGTAFGGVIATNQVVGNASAYIEHAHVTTTTGDVSVVAGNTASISATETSSLSARRRQQEPDGRFQRHRLEQ